MAITLYGTKKRMNFWLILRTNGFSFSFCPQNHILLLKQGLLLFNSVFRCTLVWTSKLWFISRFWEVAYFRRPLNRKNCIGSCALVHKVVRKDQIIICHQSKSVTKLSSSIYIYIHITMYRNDFPVCDLRAVGREVGAAVGGWMWLSGGGYDGLRKEHLHARCRGIVNGEYLAIIRAYICL